MAKDDSRIPAHVWSLILPHLRKPVPAALSKVPRAELRQDDLATACRVSKHFRDICHPILYTHIVTDDLPRLLNLALCTRTRKLFANTRSLTVEYTDKLAEASYISICKDGGEIWWECGLTREETHARLWVEWERESRAFFDTLTAAKKVGPSILFPRIKSFAVASIYESTSTIKDAFDSPQRRLAYSLAGKQASVSMVLFEDFTSALHLQHLCIRDMSGCLSFSNGAHKCPRRSYEPNPVNTYVHLPPDSVSGYFPLPLGYPVRYSVDAAKGDDWAAILRVMQLSIYTLSGQRADDQREGCAFRPADIEIFCSTDLSLSGTICPSIEAFGVVEHFGKTPIPRFYTPAEQAEMAERLGESLQARLRRDSGLPDKVKWRAAAETPICGACRTGPPV